ncbi:MAG: hypothetical protein O7A63_00915 [Acidobacteria bacterium]|nr:hypothetical protein [Acidobacteriota bacterium]
MKVSRRRFSRYLLAAPVAAAASTGALGTLLGDGRAIAAEKGAAEAKPSAMSRFLVRENPDLSREERRAIRRDVTQIEGTLKGIRDFPLKNDVPPAMNFRPMKSKRSNGGRR